MWQNSYVKLSPKVRKVYFYDPGKMPLLRCAPSFKTNSEFFNSEVSKFSISHNQYRIFQFSNFSKPVLFIFSFFFFNFYAVLSPGTLVR